MRASESTYDASTYTVEDYLFGCVNIDVPSELLVPLLLKRGVEPGTLYSEATEENIKLLEADLYVKIATTTPDKVNSVSDSDNGWEHSGGGFSITDDYRDLLLAEANKIYEAYDEPLVGKSNGFRMRSHGIQRARTTLDGTPLPHIV